MKNLYLIFISLFSLLLITSCSKSEEDLEDKENIHYPQIEMISSEVLVTPNGGEYTISFNSKVPWTAEVMNTRTEGWCSIYPTSGSAGNVNITISTTHNETYDNRTASVLIKAGTVSKTINISQKQKDAIIISNKYVNVEKEGATVEVKVNTNVDFEVHIPENITWIKKAETRALCEKSFCLDVESNTSDLSRNAIIEITDKERKVSDTLVIIQQGAKTVFKIACSENEEELEDWSAGLFGGEGTYIMGKPHGDSGYLMTIGNILEEKSAIVYIDKYRQVREIFIDNTIIAFGEKTDEGVDVFIKEKGCEGQEEHVVLSISKTRSSGDHSQQVAVQNLIVNLYGSYEAINEIVNSKGFSKKGIFNFVINKTDGMRNFIKAIGGPDIFNETFSNWFGTGMNVVGIADLMALYGSKAVAGPIGACVSSYIGLYSTYLELYDEHIEAYFGKCQVEIDKLAIESGKLNINVKASGHEKWYNNIECGVIVKQNSFPAPRYSEGLSTQKVVENGNYIFVEENIQVNKTYYCRPFLIDKNKVSLWKGFIGDWVGPLVRYGEVKSIGINCSATTGEYLSVTDNSAIVKCSYSNVDGFDGIECGVMVVNSDTGESKDFKTNNVDGERDIELTGLLPATTYIYNAYIKTNNTITAKGKEKSFTTNLPDISGTWKCREKWYDKAGNPYWGDYYTITLHNNGEVSYTNSKGEQQTVLDSSWGLSKKGRFEIFTRNQSLNYTHSWYEGGKRWKGNVNDIKNPTKITGTANTWAANQIGSFEHDGHEFEMTR